MLCTFFSSRNVGNEAKDLDMYKRNVSYFLD